MRGWDALVASCTGAHVLQTHEWAQLKAQYGWQPLFIAWKRGQDGISSYETLDPVNLGNNSAGEPDPAAAALVLRRSLPIRGLSARLQVLYIPKGPLLDWNDAVLRRRVLEDLHRLGRRQGAFLVKMDPDVRLGTGVPGREGAWEDPSGAMVMDDLRAGGWRFSSDQIQFRNTVVISLDASEAELLGRMKQKTRYNIRLAERKGVIVRVGTESDLQLLYRMYAETSVRDGFVIREEAYYRAAWKIFLEAGLAEPLIAEVAGEPVAAVIVFRFAARAWYLYGMSRELHRDYMPNYLLQWEAIRRAKAAGCLVYDLWGAPEVFAEGDPLWRVFRFKEGLGGTVLRTLGAWDLPVQPLLYSLYTRSLPRLLDWMRRRGKERTRENVIQGA